MHLVIVGSRIPPPPHPPDLIFMGCTITQPASGKPDTTYSIGLPPPGINVASGRSRCISQSK